MDVTRQSLRRLLTVAVSSLLAAGLALTLPACSEDPILGPSEESDDGGGGSYSSIHRLSPPSSPTDSTAPTAASTLAPSDPNPERF